jgi:hypothetical protein
MDIDHIRKQIVDLEQDIKKINQELSHTYRETVRNALQQELKEKEQQYITLTNQIDFGNNNNFSHGNTIIGASAGRDINQYNTNVYIDNQKTNTLTSILLKNLCIKSINLYKNDRNFLTQPEHWIIRDINLFSSEKTSMQILAGQSGFGKSAYTYLFSKEYLEKGGYVLWIDPISIDMHISLEGLLVSTLRELQPTLNDNVFYELISLINDYPLLLIIDDINHSNQPDQTMNRIIQWLNPNETFYKSKRPIFTGLCPVLPKLANNIQNNYKLSDWISIEYVDLISLESMVDFVTTFSSTSRIEAEKIANNLYGDAFILGLIALEGLDYKTLKPRDIIKKFINDSVNNYHKNAILITEDYWGILKGIVEHILIHNNYTWKKIRDSISHDITSLSIIGDILRSEKICYLDKNDALVFRHDRIFNTIAVEWFLEQLSKEIIPDILYDPYYAELVGEALSEYKECSLHLLITFRKRLPLVLAVALQSFGDPIYNHHTLIIDQLKQWSYEKYYSYKSEEVLSVLYILGETDSKYIHDILEPDYSYHYQYAYNLAKFRNGNISCGVDIWLIYDGYFINHVSHVTHIIEHLKYKNKKEFILSIVNLLNTETDTKRIKTILLFVGASRLSDLILPSINKWKENNDRNSLIHLMIWICIVSFSDENIHHMTHVFEYWSEMPDDKQEIVVDRIIHPFVDNKNLLTTNTVYYLINITKSYPNLISSISRILMYTDNYDAIIFVMNSIASRHLSSDSEHIFISHWSENSLAKQKLSEITIHKLILSWQNSTDDITKLLAFRLWLNSSKIKDLYLLQGINESSILFEYSLRARVFYSDQSALSLFITELNKNSKWIKLADKLWCNDIKQIIYIYFIKNHDIDKETDLTFLLSELLIKIPHNDAEEIIINFWNDIKYSRQFIQSAIIIGTTRCLELVSNSIQEIPVDQNIFEYFFTGLTIYRISPSWQLLMNITSYIDRFDKHTFTSYIKGILKFEEKGVDWLRKNLLDVLELRNERKYYLPTIDDLLENLDRMSTGISDSFQDIWINRLHIYHKDVDPFNLLEKWFMKNPNYNTLHVIASFLIHLGKRKNLSISNHKIKNPILDEENIIENTRYIVYRKTPI